MARRDTLTILFMLIFIASLILYFGTDVVEQTHSQEETIQIVASTETNTQEHSMLLNRTIAVPADNPFFTFLSALHIPNPSEEWQTISVPVSVGGKLQPRIDAGLTPISGGNTTLQVMNSTNYRAWQSTRQATLLYYGQNRGIHEYSFIPTGDGNYFFLVRNAQPTYVDSTFHLTAQLSWLQRKVTNTTSSASHVITLTSQILTFSLQSFTKAMILTIIGIVPALFLAADRLAKRVDKHLSRKKLQPPTPTPKGGAGIR